MKIKRIGVVSLILAMLMTLTACTNEAALYKAFLKQQKITAMKSQTDLKLNIDSQGLSEEDQVMFNIVKGVINNTELRIDQKTVRSDDSKKAQGKLFITLKNKEDINKGTIWVDADMTNMEEIKLVEIFKLPEQMKVAFGEENKNKDYMVYDVNKLMAEMGNDSLNNNKDAMNGAMEWAIKAQPKMEIAMESYFKNFKFDKKMVSKKDSKTINGEKLEMYQVKLSDKEMKDLIRYTVNYMLDDKDFNELFVEYIDLIINSAKAAQPAGEDVIEIEGLDKIKDSKEMKVKFNEFMDKLDKITVLGEKGITIDYGINKDGFISCEKGDINLQIDLGQLTGLNENIELKKTGKINIQLVYTAKLTQINDKDMVVDMPVLTDENSFDMVDFIKSLEAKMKNAAPKVELDVE